MFCISLGPTNLGSAWTDPEKSEIYNYNIRPAGEYSKLFIRTKTKDGIPKTVGELNYFVIIDKNIGLTEHSRTVR